MPVLTTIPVFAATVTAVGVILALFILAGVRYIPSKSIGVVEKRWSRKGSVVEGLIALNKEAGYQPHVLRGGLHYLLPFQFKVHIMPLVTIPHGKIGYLFARDGKALEPTQTLASNSTAGDFEDVEHFLRNGGQRGPQRKILREGTYAINLAQFVAFSDSQTYFLPLDNNDEQVFASMATVIRERHGFEPVVIKGADDMLGIVTVHDGPSLAQNEIIAPVVGSDPADAPNYHNNFQDPERFLNAKGRRGRQLQVLVEGTYFLNRLFATVELVAKTIVEVGHVGVVVSYTGETGIDLSGVDYKHGELVHKGERGVWSEALLPGKYAFNTYAGKVIIVPTTNFILKWIRNQSGAHRYDENLSEVSLITKDAFEPSLPLSVVVHIDYRKAPLVIQRFGDVKRLVEQTLDPMVSAYFKNIGQTRTVIQLLQDRATIQQIAGEEMKEKFAHYNLELEEVLIGTPSSSASDNRIEDILTQLRMRQIAVEQIETYARQETAAGKERSLREAEARSRQQQQLTESEILITIQSNQGKAEYQRSLQQAAQVKALAEAEAEKSARIGVAQAIAIEEQVRAYGGPQFQLTQQVMTRFAEAIQQSKVDVVPKFVMQSGGSDGGKGSGSLIEAFLAMLLSDQLKHMVTDAGQRQSNPTAEALKTQIRDGMGRKQS